MIPNNIFSICVFWIKSFKLLIKLLNNTITRNIFNNLKYLKRFNCGRNIGKNASKGMDAIKLSQLPFCFKNFVLGLKVKKLMLHSIKRSTHMYKSNSSINEMTSDGRCNKSSIDIKNRSIITNN